MVTPMVTPTLHRYTGLHRVTPMVTPMVTPKNPYNIRVLR